MIYVYGASDDLVEVAGEISEEFQFYGDGHLVFESVDRRLHIWPHYDGVWTFRVAPEGDQTGEYFEPMPWPVEIDGPTGYGGAPSYSTVVRITNDVSSIEAKWVA